ncbi:MAG: PAS domain S-box protein [Bacteroidota bacterium]
MSETKLKAIEAKYNALINYAGDAIIMVDFEYNINEVNKSACNLLNYTSEELLHLKMYDLIAADEKQLFIDRVKLIDKVGGSIHERWMKRKDGSFVETEVNVRVIEDVGYISIIRDITERKRIEKELIESELRFREVLENSLSASYKRNLNTNTYEYLSPVFKKIAGYTQDELNTTPIEIVLGLMHPDDVEAVKTGLTKAIEEPAGFENCVEYRFKHKSNGEYRWLKDEFVVMKDAEGNPASLIGSVSDITEQKESELNFRNLVEKSFVGVYIIQKEKFVYVNPKFAHDLGYIQDELININDFREIVDESYTPDALIEWRKKLEAGVIDDFHIELKYKRKDGSMLWAEVFCGETSYKGAKAILGGFQDITERKSNEAQIQESEEKFRMSFMTSQDAFYIGTLNEGRIIDINESFCDLFGYSREESIGKTTTELNLFIDPDDRAKIISAFKANKNLKDLELTCKRKNGTLVRISITINTWTMNNEQVIMAVIRDITERKQIEQELIESREQLSLFIEHSPASLAMFDTEMCYIATSRRWMNDYNLGNQTIIGKNHYEVFPEIQQEWKDIHQRCLKGAIERNEEDSFIRIDGTRDWMRWEIRPWRKSTGEIGGIIMFTEVITESIIAREKFTASQETRKHIINSALDAIVGMDKQGLITIWTPQAERIFGWTEAETLGQKMSDVIIPLQYRQGHERGLKHYGHSGEGRVINKTIEISALHKSGKEFPVELSIAVIKDNGNDFFCSFIRDISERKKLEEQQRLMTSIVNSSEDAIISKSLDGIVTSWNHGAESILGYAASETIGNPIRQMIPPHLYNEEIEILTRIKKGESVDHYETVRKKKNGELIHVSLTISPIFDAAGHVIGASKILRDISDRKLLELEREKNMHELLQRNRDLEQFSYIVSHNLRSPVATILGLTDILQDVHVEPVEKDQLIHGMGEAAHNLDSVIRDLNTILQVKRDLSEKKESILLSNLIKDIKVSLSSAINYEKVKFECDFEAVNELITIKTYIYSIFYNLISNSIKYRQPNVDPVIRISSEIRDNKTVLHFGDNGLGIDLKRNGKNVFGLYKRFHFHIAGKGMGLYMIKTQVEALGGKISIKSRENFGTDFTIEFEN